MKRPAKQRSRNREEKVGTPAPRKAAMIGSELTFGKASADSTGLYLGWSAFCLRCCYRTKMSNKVHIFPRQIANCRGDHDILTCRQRDKGRPRQKTPAKHDGDGPMRDGRALRNATGDRCRRSRRNAPTLRGRLSHAVRVPHELGPVWNRVEV